MRGRKIKLCFCASSGGHYEQIMMLRPLMDKYDSFIVTEKTHYNVNNYNNRVYYLRQVNRKQQLWLFYMLYNSILSLIILIKERPSIVISTGALSTIPMCILEKAFKGKLIFIESFAKVTVPTETGRLLYKIADRFYVQWPQMKEVYPDAIYLGGIY